MLNPKPGPHECTQVPKKTPYVRSLTRALLGWPKDIACPEGHWHKGALTVTLCQFLEDVAAKRSLEDSADEYIRLIEPKLL